MNKIARLTQEFFFSLTAYKNPFAYLGVRGNLMGSRKVEIELRSGAKYLVHADTNEIRMINEIWNLKVYDKLLDRVHDGSRIIDIGANIGGFTIKAGLSAPNVKVYSYEPFPASFASLQENIRLNGLEKTVVATNAAVAGAKGELELFFRPHDPGGVSLYQYGDKTELSSIKVPAITLEDIFRDKKIETCDYLKMDCEGAEEQILLNAPKELFPRIKSMTMEWHGPLNKMSVDDFRAFLHGVGYETSYYEPTITLYAWR